MSSEPQEIWAAQDLIDRTKAGEEIWLPVVDSDGTYDVSNMGNVRSWLPRGGGKRRLAIPSPIKPCLNTNGYPCVGVRKNGKRTYQQVHFLIAEAFIGPRPGKLFVWEIGHEDGVKTHNRLDNLKWCTKVVNALDKRRHVNKCHRAHQIIDGIKWYRCTGECKAWKPFTDFKELPRKTRSFCGIFSACIVCSRKRGAESRRLNRQAAKDAA